MQLIEKLQKEEPKRNIVFTAIEKLTNPKEIEQFYKEYVEYLRKRGDQETRNNPEKVADENIGYILGYYSAETAQRWMEVLKSVRHPIFGKNIPFGDPAKAYKMGKSLITKNGSSKGATQKN